MNGQDATAWVGQAPTDQRVHELAQHLMPASRVPDCHDAVVQRLPNRWQPCAGARHLDAYDTHPAQYWPVLQRFLADLPPALPEEGAQASAAQAVVDQ